MRKTKETIDKKQYITIAIRGIAVLPGMTANLQISREVSKNALKAAKATGSNILFVMQRDVAVLEPKLSDLNKVGVVAKIEHTNELKNGNLQIVAEGLFRAELLNYTEKDGYFVSETLVYDVIVKEDEINMHERLSKLWEIIDKYVDYLPMFSEKTLEPLRNVRDIGHLVFLIAGILPFTPEDRQSLLDITDTFKRLDKLEEILYSELSRFRIDSDIHAQVKNALRDQQKEMYLRAQLRVIQNELGEGYDDLSDDEGYRAKIKAADLPDEVSKKLLGEVSKLEKMSFSSPEATVIRNFIDTCLELPWNKKTEDRLDINTASKILDEDHDGLCDVKERVLEFLAVKQMSPDLNGQIICLVGPPGVGKTSIGRSIARAMEREYVRISLGGIRDEAEIRGHRKTYIGSMPGRIINAIKSAGVKNPVLLLDEVDKLTKDSHGDPTSALLEVLDGEQNVSFRDHFIELPFDLSDCFFIATANTVDTIPAPLLDRMEVIRLDSYTDIEKLSIAKHHLIPKQQKKHGIAKRNLKISDGAVMAIIDGYTREAGVRNLEREIASVCRKAAKLMLTEDKEKISVTKNNIKEFLGAVKFIPERVYSKAETGVSNGLAWTSVGGELLRIEVLSMDGTGKLELTGSLGDVMKESARAAVSYIRKHCADFNIDPEFYKKKDIHIHVPEGAVPKDGPSAGVAITLAMVSELSGIPIDQSVAMTGEITLTGRVLAIGGLREKAMAAYKTGAKTVIIPKDNEKDLEKIDDEVKNALRFVPVERFSEAAFEALVKYRRCEVWK